MLNHDHMWRPYMYWVGYNVTFLFLFHANKINAIQIKVKAFNTSV